MLFVRVTKLFLTATTSTGNKEDVIRTSAGGDVVAPGIGDFDSTNN